MARVIITAPNSGSGKTTVTMGILRALCARGIRIQPFKAGPDYIDTAYHSRICGQDAVNLDVYLMGEIGVKEAFVQYDTQDISVIEGAMGMFDGLGSSTYSSTAHLAILLQTPIILVMDARGIAATAAAIVQGLANYSEANIFGIIFNRIRSEPHYHLLKMAVEEACGIPCLGYLPVEKDIAIDSRHLGILPQFELEDADTKLDRIQELVEKYIILDEVLAIAERAPKLTLSTQKNRKVAEVIIAVAYDRAFNFYYRDNLQVLEDLGAKLEYFSPLQDSFLPDCHGVYIGGGFPEIFASSLVKNSAMRGHILKSAEAGMPIYAECGGYMYLMKHIVQLSGEKQPMCGVFQGDAILAERLSGQFGYVKSELLCDTPIGLKGMCYRNHEFHHSRINTHQPAYRAEKVSSGKTWTGGSVFKQTFGTYAHAYFRGNLSVAQNFIRSCEKYAQQR